MQLVLRFLLALFIFPWTTLLGQNCFEIEAILVDACGNPEGTSEMVRFRVGPQNLQVNQLSVSWPNNAFLGICQNSNTSAKVQQINNQITQCGFAKEPVNGVLPAGASVLLITSENVNINANSFANLADTIYVIFQCAGNTAGHFANATGAGQRTLSMFFSSPSPCSDLVTYQCAQLVDQNGIAGPTSPSNLRDGALVDFSTGNAVYANNGCQIPAQPLFLNVQGQGNLCPGDTLWLDASHSSSLSNFTWTGGAGTFLNQGLSQTAYIVGAADLGNVTLQVNASNCNGNSLSAQYSFLAGSLPTIQLNPGSTALLCPGGQVALQASGSGVVQWLGGPTNSTYTVQQAGTYVVEITNACGSSFDSILVQDAQAPEVEILDPGPGPFCANQALTLQGQVLAGNVNQVQWQDGTSGYQLTTNTTGWLVFSAFGPCGQDQDSLYLDFLPAPLAQISSSNGQDFLCPGDSLLLLASGQGNLQWIPGGNGGNIWINAPGTFVLEASNSCGTDSDSFTVTAGNPTGLSWLGPSDTTTCPQPFLDVAVTANAPTRWSNGKTGSTNRLNQSGVFWVMAQGQCSNDSLFGHWNILEVEAVASLSPLTGMEPLTIEGLGQLLAPAVSGFWLFPPDSMVVDTVLNHTFFEAGNYTVQFVALNALGCRAVESFEVLVRPDPYYTLFLPFAFTPNGDGINDVLKVYGSRYRLVQALVFNRWGEEIFGWSQKENGWDGRIDGKEAPLGTYVLKVRILTLAGEEVEQVQGFQLLR